MGKRQSGSLPPDPVPKIFTSVREIETAIGQLSRRVEQVYNLRREGVRFDGPEHRAAESSVRATILEVFGPGSPEYREHQYHKIWDGVEYVDMDPEYEQECFVAGVAQTEGMLKGLVARLEEKKLTAGESEPAVIAKQLRGSRIFLGHGRSEQWRVLASFLTDRLGLQYEEFNREPAAGYSTKERLEQMLESSGFAFLIMTADDEHGDGALHARENVVHEVGLFQGRHGFLRAIVLLEEGCAEFSNIHGLVQIRFPRNDLFARSEEIRRILEREGLLKR